MDHYLVLMWRIFSQWNNHNMTRMKMTRMAKLGFWSASCGTFIPSTAVTHICPPLFNTYLPTLVNTGQTFPAQLHTNTLCKICTCKTSFNQNHSMLLLVSPESPRSQVRTPIGEVDFHKETLLRKTRYFLFGDFTREWTSKKAASKNTLIVCDTYSWVLSIKIKTSGKSIIFVFNIYRAESLLS